MRKIIQALLLVTAFLFVYAVIHSSAQETTLINGSSENLLGVVVQNPQGDYLGTVTDVVSGPGGRVAFVVLGYWLSDDTQRLISVPIGVLSCEEERCFLNANKEVLSSAPAFISEDDLIEPKTAEDVYRYFGIQPYWTEEWSKE